MAIALHPSTDTRILEIQVSGKLTHEDYQMLGPSFENWVQQRERARVLFDMVNFEGWEPRAFWDDLKFDLKYFADVKRFAMVGDQGWQKNLTELSRPFTAAEVRFFDRNDIEAARRWLLEV